MKEHSVKCTVEGPVGGRESTGRQAEIVFKYKVIPLSPDSIHWLTSAIWTQVSRPGQQVGVA